MKKISVLLPVIFLGILIFLVILDLKNSKIITNTNNKQNQEKTIEEVSNNRDEFIIKNFVEENEKYLNKNYYDNLKFSVLKKDIVFKNLSEKTKSIIFISKCLSIKKEAKNLKSTLSFSTKEPTALKKFEEELQDHIDKEKKILYEQYGRNVHPLDKLLLEKLNE